MMKGPTPGEGGVGRRLQGAYDPSQIEALDSLLKAQTTLADQQQKPQDQMNQQRRDSIRTAYQKILEAQKKVDGDTLTIDQSPKDSDGQLSHKDAIRLGQLPTEQSDLADQTAKLDDQITFMGGIVYAWANKDIVDSMHGVKDLLAKPETGVPTQAEQKRIEEQLTAMIESFRASPKPQQFAQHQQNQQQRQPGQGQGGQAPATSAAASGGSGIAFAEAIAVGGE